MKERPPLGGAQDLFRADRETVPLPVMVRAEGIYFWSEHGRRYLDVSSGPVVSNIGHGDERVAKALYDQARTLDFASSRQARHQPNIALAERIARLAGPGFERVCLSSGGSEAVEIALKFLRQYRLATGEAHRSNVISCLPSYHGSSIGTLTISGDEAYLPFLDGFAQPAAKIPAPLTYRLPAGETTDSYGRLCADALEERISELGAENVLAFIIEPIGGLATGCVVPPRAYLEEVRAICDRHGVFLVFDEVLCGAGRTGKFLAAHHWPSVRPDLVTLAKGLGAGYVPLGATLAPAHLVDHLASLTGFGFTHTYSANPIMCAGALAVLDIYESENLVDRAAEIGAYLRRGLERLSIDYPVIGDIRGQGLLLAVEIVRDPRTKTPFTSDVAIIDRIRTTGLEHDLLIYGRRTAGGTYGDWFMVSPPLTITEPQCDELLVRLAATLDQVTKETTDLLSAPT
ncbi:MAG: aspartate aminotransferase family protein [Geminicoccaceae bacterium]|jgi:adenosylmethionine-8-amino-7-oxononanoate aminotransferase